MTILKEFGTFEEEINAELNGNLPLLATTKILMECVKAGMGREVAHELIKKHSTKSKDFFRSLVSEEDFPLTLDQLNSLIENPADFAGSAIEQSDEVKKLVASNVKGKVSKVELSELR
jgi:adenylosuccinate lyase